MYRDHAILRHLLRSHVEEDRHRRHHDRRARRGHAAAGAGGAGAAKSRSDLNDVQDSNSSAPVPASSLACALNSAADREKHADGIAQVGAREQHPVSPIPISSHHNLPCFATTTATSNVPAAAASCHRRNRRRLAMRPPPPPWAHDSSAPGPPTLPPSLQPTRALHGAFLLRSSPPFLTRATLRAR